MGSDVWCVSVQGTRKDRPWYAARCIALGIELCLVCVAVWVSLVRLTDGPSMGSSEFSFPGTTTVERRWDVGFAHASNSRYCQRKAVDRLVRWVGGRLFFPLARAGAKGSNTDSRAKASLFTSSSTPRACPCRLALPVPTATSERRL